jgi:hypothetical protein
MLRMMIVGFVVLVNVVPAVAQVTINSTGVVSGTIAPPSKNPTFNQGTTRVDTDSQGRYFRNGELIFDAQAVNPNLVGIDAKGNYYVDFRGIPVVSQDGTLVSPALDGSLNSVQRFNNDKPVRFWGNVQDEFVVQGDFQGTATDAAGQQYQGTFRIKGQGPRYSAANGGTSPTVFDFKSYYNFKANPAINPTPTVKSYFVTAMPVKLTITVPAGIGALPPGTNPGTNPGTIPGTNLPLPIDPPPSELTVLETPIRFEVNRVVLGSGPSKPAAPSIGPRSRVLIRR